MDIGKVLLDSTTTHSVNYIYVTQHKVHQQ